jgi:hypothetical protein
MNVDPKWYIETGERLARIEALLTSHTLQNPCDSCENIGSIIRMRQNLRLINWVGGLITAGALYKVGQWLVDKMTLPFN